MATGQQTFPDIRKRRYQWVTLLKVDWTTGWVKQPSRPAI